MDGAAAAILGLTAGLALAAGCGGGDDPTTPADPTGALVVYERGGGIAGVAERLEVRRDGTATLTVGSVDEQRTEFELSDSELDRLTRGLEAAEFEDVASTDPNACADCFIDEVTYEGESTTVLPEIDHVPDSVGAVLTELRSIVDES